MKITVILFFLIAYTCIGQVNQNDLKIIDSISRNHLNKLFRKDIAGFLGDYEKYYDVGNGKFTDFGEWEKDLQKFVNSKEFLKYEGITADKLIDKVEIYSYDEILIKRPSISRHAPKFTLEKNDYLVYAYFRPEYRGIMVEEGWFGFFRLVEGKWKIVAGD
jgi:hypothetical protein